MRKLTLLTLVCAGLIACKKDDAQKTNPTTQGKVENFSDLNVNPNFDWESGHMNSLLVEGLENATSAKRFLTVATPDGLGVQKVWTSINQDHTLQFDLADQYDHVVVRFGTIEKKVDMKNRKGSFDYMVADDRSDLDPSDR